MKLSHKLTKPQIDQPVGSEGFTFVEIIVGSILVSLAVAGAVSLTVGSNTLLNRTELQDRHEALIDADIATIREIARNLTWCPGTPSLACASLTADSEDYYFPAVPNNGSTKTNQEACNDVTGCQEFIAACESSGILTALKTEIDNKLPNSNLTGDGDLVRTIIAPSNATIDGIDDIESHRLRINYSNSTTPSNLTVARSVIVVPTVASWCP